MGKEDRGSVREDRWEMKWREEGDMTDGWTVTP